jgi:translation initiation factor 4E
MIQPPLHENNELMTPLPLSHKWNIYYHLPNDKSWDIQSYKHIINVSTVEEIISLNENTPENIIKYCMLFIMKDNIAPMWEDSNNKNGGCFSYKIPNKIVVNIWKQMVYALCGGTLMVKKEHFQFVNGITISPKKNFCIIKIWLENLKLQNPDFVINIPNLSKNGVIFKSHTQ